jgi:hypothetical protein
MSIGRFPAKLRRELSAAASVIAGSESEARAEFGYALAAHLLNRVNIRRFSLSATTRRPPMKEDEPVKDSLNVGPEPELGGRMKLSAIRSALTSESFIEKAAVIVLTALLSGLIVPYFIARYNNYASALQRANDLARSKNESILQAQSKMIEDFATVVLTYETLALDVSWYKTKDGKDEKLYEKAYVRYSDRIADLLSNWRSLAARSQALTSPAISAKMNAFQRRVFLEQDTPMNTLNRSHGTEEQWTVQHTRNEEMIEEAGRLISEIMRDLGLSKSDLP